MIDSGEVVHNLHTNKFEVTSYQSALKLRSPTDEVNKEMSLGHLPLAFGGVALHTSLSSGCVLGRCVNASTGLPCDLFHLSVVLMFSHVGVNRLIQNLSPM